jgi:hypothetical protein
MASPLEPSRVLEASAKAGAEVVEVAVGFLRLPGRILKMVDSTEALLARADNLMAQAEQHLEYADGLVPVLRQVDKLGPDVDEVRRAVLGIPGVGMIWRRGQATPESEGSVGS